MNIKRFKLLPDSLLNYRTGDLGRVCTFPQTCSCAGPCLRIKQSHITHKQNVFPTTSYCHSHIVFDHEKASRTVIVCSLMKSTRYYTTVIALKSSPLVIHVCHWLLNYKLEGNVNVNLHDIVHSFSLMLNEVFTVSGQYTRNVWQKRVYNVSSRFVA